MPSPSKRTVLLYNDGLVFVARGHAPADSDLYKHNGHTPVAVFRVIANGDYSALCQALAMYHKVAQRQSLNGKEV